jgi:hypothetical protein
MTNARIPGDLPTPGGSPPALLSLGELLGLGRPPDSEAAVAKLVEFAVLRVYVYRVGRASEIAKLESRGQENLARAIEFLEQQSKHPWEARLGRSPQVLLGKRVQEPPDEGSFSPPRGYWGHGVFRPRLGGLWTTTAIEGWPLPRTSTEHSTRGVEPRRWSYTVRSGARVLEIRGPQDWQQLAEQYAALVESEPLAETPEVALPAPLYLPDWRRVARDWDAVRITMSGKLKTLFVPLRVRDGYTLLHVDEGDEETLWLNWALESIGEL